MKLLLAFGNRAKHGKDSAATAIIDHIEKQNERLYKAYGNNSPLMTFARNFKFAEALYEECRTLHGMTEKDAPLLQRIGQARRQEDSKYWINQTFDKIDLFFKSRSNAVAIITDARHLNEAAEVKDRGGYLINLTRLNSDGTPFVSSDRPADHPSEVDLDGYNFDYYIRTHDGEEALAGEIAITIYEYIRGLKS